MKLKSIIYFLVYVTPFSSLFSQAYSIKISDGYEQGLFQNYDHCIPSDDNGFYIVYHKAALQSFKIKLKKLIFEKYNDQAQAVKQIECVTEDKNIVVYKALFSKGKIFLITGEKNELFEIHIYEVTEQGSLLHKTMLTKFEVDGHKEYPILKHTTSNNKDYHLITIITKEKSNRSNKDIFLRSLDKEMNVIKSKTLTISTKSKSIQIDTTSEVIKNTGDIAILTSE